MLFQKSEEIGEYIFEFALCPLLADNTTVCNGVVNRMGHAIAMSLPKSFLHPTYFCEQVVPLCNTNGKKKY